MLDSPKWFCYSTPVSNDDFVVDVSEHDTGFIVRNRLIFKQNTLLTPVENPVGK
jgi:hypothetical protein